MDYSFRSVGRVCSATGAELPPGSLCRSALVERDGRLERLDFSIAAWNGSPPGTIGHWRVRVPAAAAAQPKRIDTDALFAEFERLEETGHRQTCQLRYVLALLLLGRKRLELDGTRSDGEIEYLVLNGSTGEGPFEVRDESLTEEEIATIQREFLAVLAAEHEVVSQAGDKLSA